MTRPPALVPFGRDIWLADGTCCAVAGFRYPTRAVVVRLQEGAVLVWSPVRLTDALREAVATIGPVRHLVAPNALHHLYLGDWQAAFPEARTYAPPGLRKKRADLRFDQDLIGGDAPQWQGELDYIAVTGNLITTEIVFFHRESGTVLFTDLIQQFPKGWFRGWRAVVARLDRMTTEVPEVPRKFRLAFVRRGAARQAVSRILEWPIESLVMAHGAPVPGQGAAAVRHAFRWLRV